METLTNASTLLKIMVIDKFLSLGDFIAFRPDHEDFDPSKQLRNVGEGLTAEVEHELYHREERII